MYWDAFNSVRNLLDQRQPEEALAKLESEHSALAENEALTASLKAQCLEGLGRDEEAFQVLNTCVEAGTTNEWVFFGLARVSWKVGRFDVGIKATQRYHKLLGWSQSEENDYVFTHDFFAPNIPNWTRLFNTVIVREPLACLEIGSWQGGSSTWLLDNVISRRPGSYLLCIDAFEGSSEHSSYIDNLNIEEIFDNNILKTGHKGLVRKLKGYSQDVLLGLGGSFDFIYVDGAHEAKFVIQDAFLSWRLLKNGGFMLFDDYPFRFIDSPEQNTAVAVDQFISWHKEEVEVIEKERQLLLRRKHINRTIAM